jgi:hypothetical protein
MSKKVSIIAALVCALAFTGTVLAEEAATQAPDATAAATPMAPAKQQVKTSIRTGEVVSVDVTGNSLVVKNSEGKEANTAFDVTAKTNIRKAGKEIALSDIVAGDKVIVAYKHKDDKRIATAIKVKAPKAVQSETTPAAAPAAMPAQAK